MNLDTFQHFFNSFFFFLKKREEKRRKKTYPLILTFAFIIGHWDQNCPTNIEPKDIPGTSGQPNPSDNDNRRYIRSPAPSPDFGEQYERTTDDKMVPPSLASGYMPSNMTSGNGSAHGSRSPRDHASDDRRPQSPTGPNGGPYPYFDSQIRDAEYLALQVLKDADKAKNGATIDQEALDMDPLANLPSKVLKKMKKGGHTDRKSVV